MTALGSTGHPVPPGAWPSPLSAADVARAGTSYGALAADRAGRRLWWEEQRPAEGGRAAVLRRDADTGLVEELLPGFDARSRVHEYGGGAWVPAGDGAVAVGAADQRLWRVRHPGDRPVALTAETGARQRHADPVVVGGAVVCVRESHGAGDLRRALVRVPLDGGDEAELFAGPRFLSTPRPSPDGTRLVWLSWEHPHMPWQSTTLWCARLGPGGLERPRVLAGGPGESLFQPGWTADGRLLVVSDRSGWWNLHRVEGAGAEGAGAEEDGDVRLVPVLPAEEEQGWPQWLFGTASWAALDDGRVALVHGSAAYRLDVVDPASGRVQHLGLPRTAYRPHLAAAGSTVLAVAASPRTRYEVIAVDAATGGCEVVRGAPEPLPAPEHLPVPEALQVPSADGRTVHAHRYPPTSPVAGTGPAPHVLFVHGGPTAQSQAAYSPQVAFFTSRGIGVVDVDYGGSTGYGRAYREALDGRWGVVDVEDCTAVARWLVAQGLAPEGGVGIRGGSAGGFTVLAALTGTDAFAAGVSHYGVADLRALAEDTHDFESRYLDSLVGPLPEAADAYAQRSPLSHVDGLSCPVLLLQGAEDPVVPPAQAEAFAEALHRKGIPHALLVFEGERHGFQRAETVQAALEAELSFYGQVWGFDPPGVPRLPLRR